MSDTHSAELQLRGLQRRLNGFFPTLVHVHGEAREECCKEERAKVREQMAKWGAKPDRPTGISEQREWVLAQCEYMAATSRDFGDAWREAAQAIQAAWK